MRTHSFREITRLIVAWGEGEQSALEELARTRPRGVAPARTPVHGSRATRGHTLQTFALVNEAYLRLESPKEQRRGGSIAQRHVILTAPENP